MKKILMLAVIVSTLSFATETQASILDKIVLYIPNRLVDVMDIFTLNLGLGAKAKAEVYATHAFGFGAGIGASAKVIKDYNRQYGGCLENGWNTQFMAVAAEDSERTICSRGVQKYIYFFTGVPSYEENIYNFYTGARDYWELKLGLAALVEADVSLHPVELADLVTGFFFYDLKGDDYTVDDLSL